eukprot:3365655-Prymnesium_polylepis.1
MLSYPCRAGQTGEPYARPLHTRAHCGRRGAGWPAAAGTRRARGVPKVKSLRPLWGTYTVQLYSHVPKYGFKCTAVRL